MKYLILLILPIFVNSYQPGIYPSICSIGTGPGMYPSICSIGTGPGNPELMTVAAVRRLKDTDGVFICESDVSNDIKELIRGRVITRNKNTHLFREVAGHILNGNNVYRIFTKNKQICQKEIDKYNRWKLEILVIPGVENEEFNL